MRLEFSAKAKTEIAAIGSFYRLESEALEQRFLGHLRKTLDLVVLHPKIGREMDRKNRRINLEIFPHFVIYYWRPGRIVVASVSHQSRNPQDLKHRLS